LSAVEPRLNSEHEDDERLSDRIVDAAVQAEFETGLREDTVDEAKSSVIIRLGRMILGFLVTFLGILAIPLPGPGWLIVIAGLSILAKDFAWAARVILFIRRRIPGVPEDGQIPRRTWIIMGVITTAAIAASIWYYLFGGQDTVAGWF